MSSILTRRGLLAGLVGSAIAGGCDDKPTVTVYLVRHAEKAKDGSKDPPLSDEGARRAEALVKALDGTELVAVYASQYRRTQLTVQPAAKARGMQVEVVDAGDTAALVSKIRRHKSGAVLVAGHSNTVPELADKLGVKDKIELGESDYGDLFVVRAAASTAKLERRTF